MDLEPIHSFIRFCQEVINSKEKQITLDLMIMRHKFEYGWENRQEDREDRKLDIRQITASGEGGITFEDIARGFRAIRSNERFKKAFGSGRTYFFSGFRRTGKDSYVINWDS